MTESRYWLLLQIKRKISFFTRVFGQIETAKTSCTAKKKSLTDFELFWTSKTCLFQNKVMFSHINFAKSLIGKKQNKTLFSLKKIFLYLVLWLFMAK